MTPAGRRVTGALLALAFVALAVTGQLASTHGASPVSAHELRRAPALAPSGAGTPMSPEGARLRMSPGDRVDPTWTTSVAARTGIPQTAVAAYGAATLRLARERRGCRLAWNTLAAIGHVESEHGTVGGRTLRPDGRPSAPVLGPALDGRDFASIPSTVASVGWHGDVRWDHAVGPMQFIPSTWARWRSDGDDDGRADPHDLFDAAYAAGRYLCASDADLTTGHAWTEAIRSYNRSDAYVALVLAAANAYAQ